MTISFQILLVATGGATGAVGRFLVSLPERSSGAGRFPWATFGVNLAGCLLMGLLIGWLWRLPPGTSEAVRLFGGVGVFGGFTTFFTCSLELFQLIARCDIWPALTYAGGSLLGVLIAFSIGLYFMRAVAP
ncbi:MAG: CrcB family protein [Pseudomonadota bacterium]|nr:CrcB family protein [Pseudomonadota bacterium]